MRTLSAGCTSILTRLMDQQWIGQRKIPDTTCLRWIKDLNPKEYRCALKDWKHCKTAGLVLTEPRPSGIQVSLNPRRLSEVRKLVKRK